MNCLNKKNENIKISNRNNDVSNKCWIYIVYSNLVFIVSFNEDRKFFCIMIDFVIRIKCIEIWGQVNCNAITTMNLYTEISITMFSLELLLLADASLDAGSQFRMNLLSVSPLPCCHAAPRQDLFNGWTTLLFSKPFVEPAILQIFKSYILFFISNNEDHIWKQA